MRMAKGWYVRRHGGIVGRCGCGALIKHPTTIQAGFTPGCASCAQDRLAEAWADLRPATQPWHALGPHAPEWVRQSDSEHMVRATFD